MNIDKTLLRQRLASAAEQNTMVTDHGFALTALGLQAEAWAQDAEGCDDCAASFDGICEGCRAEEMAQRFLERSK